jgi:hypothetical protein
MDLPGNIRHRAPAGILSQNKTVRSFEKMQGEGR